MTSIALSWYAIVSAQKGVEAGIPVLGCILLAVVGPTAGRWLIDISSGVTPKQFIRASGSSRLRRSLERLDPRLLGGCKHLGRIRHPASRS
jgi:hypothetical protein